MLRPRVDLASKAMSNGWGISGPTGRHVTRTIGNAAPHDEVTITRLGGEGDIAIDQGLVPKFAQADKDGS